MIKNLLDAAEIPSKAARFSDPPDLFAVYFDSVTADGPDVGPNRILTHDCTVELYAPSITSGDDAMQRLRAQLDAHSIHYTTQGWYWLSEVRRYQEIIEFTHIEKT